MNEWPRGIKRTKLERKLNFTTPELVERAALCVAICKVRLFPHCTTHSHQAGRRRREFTSRRANNSNNTEMGVRFSRAPGSLPGKYIFPQPVFCSFLGTLTNAHLFHLHFSLQFCADSRLQANFFHLASFFFICTKCHLTLEEGFSVGVARRIALTPLGLGKVSLICSSKWTPLECFVTMKSHSKEGSPQCHLFYAPEIMLFSQSKNLK